MRYRYGGLAGAGAAHALPPRGSRSKLGSCVTYLTRAGPRAGCRLDSFGFEFGFKGTGGKPPPVPPFSAVRPGLFGEPSPPARECMESATGLCDWASGRANPLNDSGLFCGGRLPVEAGNRPGYAEGFFPRLRQFLRPKGFFGRLGKDWELAAVPLRPPTGDKGNRDISAGSG